MSIFGKLSSFFGSSGPSAADNPLLAEVVRTVDPRLAAVPHYDQQLWPAIGQALDYYDDLVLSIPGPVRISVAGHGSDGLARALFPSATDIVAGLGRSLDVRDALPKLAQSGSGRAHAVLGMRRKRADEGEGAPDGAVFVDHTFRSLGPGDQDARLSLRNAAFSRLLKDFTAEVDELRRRQKRILSDRDLNKELAKAGGSEDDGAEWGGLRSRILDEHLAHTERDLTPERILEALVEWLGSPQTHLRLNDGASGAVVSINGSGRRLELPLMACSDRRQWFVCVADISLDEARRAVEAEARAHRYILI